MIALRIATKNLASLVSNPSSFLCKSPVSIFHSIRDFSTLDEKQSVGSTTVYDVLVNNHHFSTAFASLAASDLSRHCSPERADSVVSLLREYGFSISQLEKTIKYKPRILGVSDVKIRYKLKIFQDLGFSSEEIAKLISQNPAILQCGVKSRIVPTLALLKGLLGCDRDVARALRKSAWFLFVDLEKTLVPNVEIMKNCGIRMDEIRYFIRKFPRCALKSDVLKRSIDKVREMGEFQSRRMFILSVGVIASISEETWEQKRLALQEVGFSEGDVVEMFKKAPPSFGASTEKMKKVTELLLNTGKFDLSTIANNPSAFGFSIENRFKPRLRLLEILEGKSLTEKWPCLSIVSKFTDAKFFEAFVKPYSSELGKNLSPGLMPID